MEEDKKKAYKKEWCKFWLNAGNCKNGPNCSYAHGKNELLKYRGNYKTELCKYIGDQGKCNNGENCSFAHDESEIRKIPFFNDPNPLYQRIEGNSQPKVNICKYWLDQGICKKSDAECLFAHGVRSLENARNSTGMPMEMHSAPMFMKPAYVPQGGGGQGFHFGGPHRQIFDPSESRPPMKKNCKNWDENKSCPYGDKCKFYHAKPKEDFMHQQMPFQRGGFPRGGGAPFHNGGMGGAFRPEDRIKTRMCIYFERNGNCQKGDSCTFAHSPEEIRSFK